MFCWVCCRDKCGEDFRIQVINIYVLMVKQVAYIIKGTGRMNVGYLFVSFGLNCPEF